MKRGCFCAFCMALLLLLGGCENSTEINDLAFVMGIGVDQGEDSRYTVTAQIAKVGAFQNLGESGAGSSEARAYVNITREGRGMQSTIYEISKLTNRKLYTGHNQMIVIGSEAAKGDIAPILDFFVRSADGRFTISMLVAEGKASEVLDVTSKMEHMPAVYLQSLVEAHAEYDDIAKATMLNFLADMLDQTTAPTIPIVELVEESEGNMQAKFNGTAVFKGATMCGVLTPEQTRAMRIIKNDLTIGFMQAEAFGGYVGLRLDESRAKIQPEYSSGAFKLVVDIVQNYTIVETTAAVDFLSVEERDELAKVVERDLLALLEGTLQHTKEDSTDVFGLGAQLYRHFPKQSKPLIENWEEEYPKLEVEFNVEVVVLSAGAILRPLTPVVGEE